MADSEPKSVLADAIVGANRLLQGVAESPLFRALVRLEMEERQRVKEEDRSRVEAAAVWEHAMKSSPVVDPDEEITGASRTPIFTYDGADKAQHYAIKLAAVYTRLKAIREDCYEKAEAATQREINEVMNYISEGEVNLNA